MKGLRAGSSVDDADDWRSLPDFPAIQRAAALFARFAGKPGERRPF
jgi:hypothetical protein